LGTWVGGIKRPQRRIIRPIYSQGGELEEAVAGADGGWPWLSRLALLLERTGLGAQIRFFFLEELDQQIS
jgi:hypothetical protein